MQREPEWGIWNVLPLHPLPQPLESLTSYITRLAQANGLQSIHELAALAGGLRLENRSHPDYLAPVCSALAQIANLPPARLLDMTFFHLVQRFGRSMHPIALYRFLAGSISSTFRYCPLCLREQQPAHYSLLWRFLVLPGCAEHKATFLDQCCHCGSRLPFLRCIPQLTTCPTCQADLRSGVALPLQSSLHDSTNRSTNDLKMLLTPGSRPLEQEQAKLVGKRFAFLRRKQGLLIPEVASLMGRETALVRRIDSARTLSQVRLDDYMRYANILGYRLHEIFDETVMPDQNVWESEEQLLDQVEAAIHLLKARGQPLLPRNIADLLAMRKDRLKEYPRVKKLFNKWERQRQQDLLGSSLEREESLLRQIEPLLQQLEPTGSPLLLEQVCHLVGLTYRHMMRKYPRVKALFQQYQNKGLGSRRAPPLDEQTKVREVQAAISELVCRGEPVTLRRLREVAQLTSSQLKISAGIKALVQSHREKRSGEIF